MPRVPAGIVVAVLGAAIVSAQSADATWPPPGVFVGGGPGVVRPVAHTRVQPPYSPAAQKQRIQGIVSVACVIEPDGTVGATRIVQSLDRKFGLDDLALVTAKKWRFSPGHLNGAVTRMLVTIHLVFSLPGEPPPSTWPALFMNDASPAIDTSDWREEVAAAGKWRLRLRYPGTWKFGRNPGHLVQLVSLDVEEGLRIEQPMTMPGPMTLPVSVAHLDKFGETMRPVVGADLDSIGVGQGTLGGRWWIWQELHAPIGHLARFGINVQAPEFAQRYEGGRLWHFTTIVGGEMVTMLVTRMVRSGQTPDATERDLRESGKVFDQILRRMTFESR